MIFYINDSKQKYWKEEKSHMCNMLFKIGWVNAMQPHHTAPKSKEQKIYMCVWDLIFTLSSEKDKNRNGFYDRNRDSVGAVRVIIFWFSPRERIIDRLQWMGRVGGCILWWLARISMTESFEKTTRLDQPTADTASYRRRRSTYVSVRGEHFSFWCLLHTPCGRQIILLYS